MKKILFLMSSMIVSNACGVDSSRPSTASSLCSDAGVRKPSGLRLPLKGSFDDMRQRKFMKIESGKDRKATHRLLVITKKDVSKKNHKWEKHEEHYQQLVEKGADVNAQDERGYTPLHMLAFDACHKSITPDNFIALINLGADVSVKDKQKRTVLTMLEERSRYLHRTIRLQSSKEHADAAVAPIQKVITEINTAAAEAR